MTRYRDVRRESYIQLAGGGCQLQRQSLSLSTGKLESLYSGGEWISPILESDRFKDILFPNSRTGTPTTLFEQGAGGIPVLTSLPPPPRRAGKKRSFKKPTPLRKSSASKLRGYQQHQQEQEQEERHRALLEKLPAVSRTSSKKEPPPVPVIVAEDVTKPRSSQLGSPIIRRKRTFKDDPIQISTPLSQHFSLVKDDEDDSGSSKYSQSEAATPNIPSSAMGPVPPRKAPAKATGTSTTHGDETRLLKGPSPRTATMPYGVAVSSKLLQPTRRSNMNVAGDAGSHASKSRPSSYASSATSYYPPSTAEGASALRISISSTIYPDSAQTHSHHVHDSDDSNDDQSDASHDLYYTQPITTTTNDLLDEQTIDPDNYQLMSILSGSRLSAMSHKRQESSAKPPVPTTPKPKFTRRPLNPLSFYPIVSLDAAKQLVFEGYAEDPVPPTTNWLNQDERADLIRKSRKLARVFGRTPGPDIMAYQNNSPSGQPLSDKQQQRHHRTPSPPRHRRRMSAWPSPTETQFWVGSTTSSGNSRRHSAPLSPDDIQGEATILISTYLLHRSSDDETPHDDGMSSTFEGIGNGHNSKSKSKKTATTGGASAAKRPVSMSAQQAEEERAEARTIGQAPQASGFACPSELGVGCPRRLVVGVVGRDGWNDESAAAKRTAWLRLRRRSSSSAALPPTWVSDLERNKEELDTKEKALNVRRAQKMEKVFGVAPPQTLYHTRQPTQSTPALLQQPVTPTPKASSPAAFMLPSSEPSYFAKSQSIFDTSPTSIKTVNDRWGKGPIALGDDTVLDIRRLSKGSAIYNHYQHSMNSLNDILDRDDRESLVELHNYLNGDLALDGEEGDELLVGPFDNTPTKPSPSDTITNGTRVSMGSLASEYSDISSLLQSPKPEPGATDFQMRRKRAAKLTQFFGVHYRELINDVLQSLEKGLEREMKRGTLQAEEFDDLLQRLRQLKIKREGIF
ncbi:hypothetical protein BKA70DRAFT_1250047 [Coprinopsis sp. MPI-PUGE-AT-0042]|nr:hypothetical protein BKA70DRAFT_1250047 [Coprinopsis sp. MPI-PUGE-AT-0042]